MRGGEVWKVSEGEVERMRRNKGRGVREVRETECWESREITEVRDGKMRGSEVVDVREIRDGGIREVRGND